MTLKESKKLDLVKSNKFVDLKGTLTKNVRGSAVDSCIFIIVS